MTATTPRDPVRMLLVEDDAESGEALKSLLERRAVEVALVPTAEEALSRAACERYDIVVADIILRDMSGMDLLRRIRLTDPDYPVILITGYDSLETAIEAVRLGAQDYILKPLKSIEDLLVPVDHAVRAHRLLSRARALEAALKRSEERLRTVLSSIQAGVLVIDADTHRVTDANPAAVEMMGRPRDQIIGSSGDDALCLKTRELFGARGGRPAAVHSEVTLRRPSGTAVQVLTTVVPIVLEGREHYVASFVDITKRKEAEERLRVHEEQLRSLTSELVLAEERERRRLATEVHDSIVQALAMCKLKLDEVDSGEASAAQRQENLAAIRQFLEEGIQQARSLTFQLSPPLLYEVGLEAALDALAEQTQGLHGIRIEFEDDRMPKPISQRVGVLLFRAVRELLINIVKHAKASAARVCIRRDGRHLRITVADDGVGLDGNLDGSRIGASGGFGLFSVRERLSSLGGHLDLVSKPGDGTTVTLTAPLEEDERPASGPVAS